MARPIKKGLDYFPVDTNILSDLKVRRIKRKYGAESFLLYMTLLCDIYANCFYIHASDDYLFDLSEQANMPENKVLEIVLAMVEIGLFDSRLFHEKRILTSSSIQKRYFATKSKRLEMFDSEEVGYVLRKIDSDKTPVMESKTPQNRGLSTQSKEKKSKEKEKESTLTSFVPDVCGREQWKIWKNEMLADEDWRASATRQSGQGIGFEALLPAKLDEFCDFIISCGEKESVKTKKDFIRRFHYWQVYHGKQKETRAAEKRKPRLSKVVEMNRVGDASLEIAKQILAGKCC